MYVGINSGAGKSKGTGGFETGILRIGAVNG
jgi:hypothetical protein